MTKSIRGLTSIIGGVFGAWITLSFGGGLGFVGGLVVLITFVGIMVYGVVQLVSANDREEKTDEHKPTT